MMLIIMMVSMDRIVKWAHMMRFNTTSDVASSPYVISFMTISLFPSLSYDRSNVVDLVLRYAWVRSLQCGLTKMVANSSGTSLCGVLFYIICAN